MELMELLSVSCLLLLTIIGHYSLCDADSAIATVTPYSADDEELDCPTVHAKWITQVSVPWGLDYRAYLTVPPELRLAPSTIPEAGLGIYSRTFLSAYTWLTEYEGEVIVRSKHLSDYAFKVPRQGIVAHYVDAFDARTSNWSRWVNCARRAEEESVVYLYCAGRVYLMLTRDVYPGHELLFYYGDDYAESLGIHYKLNGTQS